MLKDRNKAVPAVYLILKEGDKILLGRRVNTGYHDGDYTVPSGHVEAGEFPCDDLQWFPLNSLPANTVPFVKEVIEKMQKEEMYSELV